MEHKHEHRHGAHECRCHAKVKINTSYHKGLEAAGTAEGKSACACQGASEGEDEEGSRRSGVQGSDHAESHDAHAHAHAHADSACGQVHAGQEHGHTELAKHHVGHAESLGDHAHGAHAHSHEERGGHGHSHEGHGHFHGGHGHSHAVHSLDSLNRAFYIGIGLNFLFTLAEFFVGYTSNSLALLADAGHNLSDVASLLISLIGLKLAQKASNSLYTYGYKKASILASLINAILLVFIAGNICIEAIQRIQDAPKLVGKSIIYTALIGVIINSVSAFLFFHGQKDDINIKGAFLHLLADAIVSVGVVLSGILIHFTGFNLIDPILSILIAGIVFLSTWSLLKESMRLSLDGVPKNVDSERVKEILRENEEVIDFHDLHIWALGSSQNAMTVHLITKEGLSMSDLMCLKNKVKTDLHAINIEHCTIEIDGEGECEFSCC